MKKLICILLVICLIVTCLVGCCCEKKEEAPARFRIVDAVDIEGSGSVRSYIIVDTETNVMYLRVNANTAFNGITVLLDTDGKPLLWEGN